VSFSGILQLKNTGVGLSGSQEIRILSLTKLGVTRTYASKNEEQPGGFAKEFLKDNTIERLYNS